MFTRPNHTKTSLLYHLTLAIPVGDPGGQAHPTALGTCAPLCGLLDAVDTGVRDFDSYGGFWSVGWKGQASQGPLLIWATGPLFTALSRHCNFSWSWAVRTRQQHIQLAAGHAANLPISAGDWLIHLNEKCVLMLPEEEEAPIPPGLFSSPSSYDRQRGGLWTLPIYMI